MSEENKDLIKFEDVIKTFKCEQTSNETINKLNMFHKELEDLMRKYKIVQTVAQIFSKL